MGSTSCRAFADSAASYHQGAPFRGTSSAFASASALIHPACASASTFTPSRSVSTTRRLVSSVRCWWLNDSCIARTFASSSNRTSAGPDIPTPSGSSSSSSSPSSSSTIPFRRSSPDGPTITGTVTPSDAPSSSSKSSRYVPGPSIASMSSIVRSSGNRSGLRSVPITVRGRPPVCRRMPQVAAPSGSWMRLPLPSRASGTADALVDLMPANLATPWDNPCPGPQHRVTPRT